LIAAKRVVSIGVPISILELMKIARLLVVVEDDRLV
jgi:hypothetical protein